MCRYILAPLGIMRLFGLITQPQLPLDIRAAAQATANRTSVCDAVAREHEAFGISAAQAHAAGSLGHIPLVVVSRGKPLDMSGLSPEQAARRQRSEDLWRTLQNDLTGLSLDSRHIIAEQSGHHIQIDQPGLVIDVIQRMVTEARGA